VPENKIRMQGDKILRHRHVETHDVLPTRLLTLTTALNFWFINLHSNILAEFPVLIYRCTWHLYHQVFASKGKADPLQAWTGPEGSRKLRLPDFVTMAQVVSLTHRPPLPPGNTPGTHFC